jgi:hypothetical protein
MLFTCTITGEWSRFNLNANFELYADHLQAKKAKV